MTKDEALKLALEALETALEIMKSDWWQIDNEFGPSNGGLAAAVEGSLTGYEYFQETIKAITALKEALAQPEQEPVAMRMPKVGDKVVCIEDESLATVVSLTAGGSPDIVFSDGSRGTYLLREFAELFGYATPPAAQRKPLTDEEYSIMAEEYTGADGLDCVDFGRAISRHYGIKENT